MIRIAPYGQGLFLLGQSVDACKIRCCQTSKVLQLEAEHAGYNSSEAEIMGCPCLITGSNATVWIVWTHHGISRLEINRIL
jgi:hypothetical protein